ncbi:MAG: Transcriptional regulator, XRE family protein [Candidatus Nomurabacteria bacterium GW2011_GWB1_37_5]|uniref:Transcriptional regulator, XRE family protein n=1 Tax=Candidatus Nomurabacteria bacterium GW2011_GWB1_37_5 TaxID=1618742 RepID=A0A0G0JDL0_9BACT|nr:MAG: Transcriptional regulator, XRE family protein [Candidatus Nomurabacteria bacterium GW2011_GWB1_37_5]
MSSTFDRIIARTPKKIKNFVEHSMDISYMMIKYMEKNKINNKQLAKKLKRKETTIERWVSGCMDFNLQQISHIEAELGIEIIPFVKIGFRAEKSK